MQMSKQLRETVKNRVQYLLLDASGLIPNKNDLNYLHDNMIEAPSKTAYSSNAPFMFLTLSDSMLRPKSLYEC